MKPAYALHDMVDGEIEASDPHDDLPSDAYACEDPLPPAHCMVDRKPFGNALEARQRSATIPVGALARTIRCAPRIAPTPPLFITPLCAFGADDDGRQQGTFGTKNSATHAKHPPARTRCSHRLQIQRINRVCCCQDPETPGPEVDPSEESEPGQDITKECKGLSPDRLAVSPDRLAVRMSCSVSPAVWPRALDIPVRRAPRTEDLEGALGRRMRYWCLPL